MRKFYATIFSSLASMLLLMISAVSIGQTTREIVGTPLTGDAGITMTMGEIIKYSDSRVRPQGMKIREELSTKSRQPKPNPDAPVVSSFPKTGQDPLLIQNNTQSFHSNFSALHAYESNTVITPPDCMGDVGPTQVCIASNNRLKWYTKPSLCETPLTTSTTSGSIALTNPAPSFSVYIEDFFAAVSNGSEVTDPHVRYDRLSQRWYIVAINTASASNRIMIAVSNTATITDLTSFTFYQFQHDQGAATGTPDQGQFCDYPTLGVDKNALYIGGLIFGASTGRYHGTSVYVVRKSSVVAGGPLVFTPFRAVGDSSDGIFCAQGVHNDDPAADRGYFVGVSASLFGELNYVVVNSPGGTPTLSSTGSINVASTSFPGEVPASGSTSNLDGADDRLLGAQMMKNKNSGASAIWANQNIGVTSAGSTGASEDRVGTRWYQLNVSGSTITLGQAGTLFDNSSAVKSYWMGGIAASGQGHAVLGASVSGATSFANVAIAGRYASTASGSLFTPVLATNYAETYNLQTGETQRWGDYSQTVVDPNDNMTMWTFQEFVSGTDRWAVRAVQLKAPPPAAVTSMTTITCSANRTTNVSITGSTGNNFGGFFDPGADAGGPGYARRLAVTSTGGVTISNVAYVNPTSLTFTLNYAAATLGSQQTLTITNPDCQSVTFNYTLPTGCIALPVSWVDVNAAWVNAQGMVNWKVANENKVKEYEVERSSDGRTFVSIGKVTSRNGAEATYNFVDLKAGEENYYRIKQIDQDGSFAYSSVVALFKKGITALGLFPNPASNQVRVLLPSDKGTVRLLDINGQLLMSTPVSSNILMVDTEKYPRGIYIIEFAASNGKFEKEKLVLK